MGFHAIQEEERTLLDVFFQVAVVLAIDDRVIDRAVELRQRRKSKMSLGNAIIASTAIVHGLTLATRNVKDFAWIDELAVVNPYGDG